MLTRVNLLIFQPKKLDQSPSSCQLVCPYLFLQVLKVRSSFWISPVLYPALTTKQHFSTTSALSSVTSSKTATLLTVTVSASVLASSSAMSSSGASQFALTGLSSVPSVTVSTRISTRPWNTKWYGSNQLCQLFQQLLPLLGSLSISTTGAVQVIGSCYFFVLIGGLGIYVDQSTSWKFKCVRVFYHQPLWCSTISLWRCSWPF